jgi:hypothetical protein
VLLTAVQHFKSNKRAMMPLFDLTNGNGHAVERIGTPHIASFKLNDFNSKLKTITILRISRISEAT